MKPSHPVLSDPDAVLVLRALVACGTDAPTDAVAERLGRLPAPPPPGAAAAWLRRLAEAGMAAYRSGPPDPAGGWLPRTLHSATPRGRAAVAGAR